MTTQGILELLELVKREKRGQWIARCPSHEDGSPSLAVKSAEDGKTLLHCHAGCSTIDVLKALHLDEQDSFPPKDATPAGKQQMVAQYGYYDETGALLYESCRFEPGDNGKRKTFRLRRPDGAGGWAWEAKGIRRVLYALGEILADTKGRMVFVVEGEKCADAMRSRGFLATTSSEGSSNWSKAAECARSALKGRHVTVIPDNDEPGRKYAADVMASLRGVAKSTRLLELPLDDLGADVADWFGSGGTAEQFTELARAATDKRPELAGIDIGTTAQRLSGERELRLAEARRIIPFEVSCLDDQLGGLMPHDLVVLTARPGAGKTQLASTIAERAARAGRRVVGFFLEADRGEIERRMKFRAIARIYSDGSANRSAARTPHRVMSYASWMRGELDDVLGPDGEAAADHWLGSQLGDRLLTIYRGKSFTLDDTERAMVTLQNDCDLFVIDHLHYLDTPDEENENRAVTAIMTKLRDLALRLGKPVLLVAHLRKEDGFRSGVVPKLADLHGSSNIVKVATRVIALAPAPHPGGDWNLAPTYVQVLKDRLDGALPLVARVMFDRRTGTYAEAYALGRITRSGNEETWEQIKDPPHWARRASGQLELVRGDR